MHSHRVYPVVFISILILSAFLRFSGIATDFPEVYEEAQPVRSAWGFWSWDQKGLDFNPRFFHYPALSFYIHFTCIFSHTYCKICIICFITGSTYSIAPILAFIRISTVKAAVALFCWLFIPCTHWTWHIHHPIICSTSTSRKNYSPRG